jgi:hypothetical protein
MRQLMSGLSRTKMLADDDDVMTWYDLQTAQGDLPTVNWSHVEDGLITRSAPPSTPGRCCRCSSGPRR